MTLFQMKWPVPDPVHAPRFSQAGERIYLGQYDQYDLYLVDQRIFPPTLVARYGDQPHEYLSANAYLLTKTQIAQCEPFFSVAWERAQQAIDALLDLNNGSAIRCPTCSRISWHTADIKHGWCGFCDRFHEDMVRKS